MNNVPKCPQITLNDKGKINWNDPLRAWLRECWEVLGLSATVIASIMGTTRGTIIGMTSRLGYQSRCAGTVARSIDGFAIHTAERDALIIDQSQKGALLRDITNLFNALPGARATMKQVMWRRVALRRLGKITPVAEMPRVAKPTPTPTPKAAPKPPAKKPPTNRDLPAMPVADIRQIPLAVPKPKTREQNWSRACKFMERPNKAAASISQYEAQFCCVRVVDGSSYCRDHHALCCVTVKLEVAA